MLMTWPGLDNVRLIPRFLNVVYGRASRVYPNRSPRIRRPTEI